MQPPRKAAPGRTTHEVIRFVIVGLANSVLSFAIYLPLLRVVPYAWAFFAAFIGGLILQTLMNIRVVFASTITAPRVLRYVTYSGTYFCVNLLVLRGLVELCGTPASYASLLTLCLLTPLHFLASRWVIAPDTGRIDRRSMP